MSDSASSTSTSGATQNGNSPSAMLANLQDALTTYEASPSSAAAGQAVVTAASDLASSLNSRLRGRSTSARTGQFGHGFVRVDHQFAAQPVFPGRSTIVAGLATGADVSSAEDTRDSILTQLSQQIGVSTIANANGSTSIYTDSGVTLYQSGVASQLSFTPTPTLTAGMSGNAVSVNGVPITGASSPMAIQSGRPRRPGELARHGRAGISGPARSDRRRPGQRLRRNDQSGATRAWPRCPDCSPIPARPACRATNAVTGLAATIEVNPAVDPSQGGDVSLLQNGGINGANYVYNTTGSAGYTGRIQQIDRRRRRRRRRSTPAPAWAPPTASTTTPTLP